MDRWADLRHDVSLPDHRHRRWRHGHRFRADVQDDGDTAPTEGEADGRDRAGGPERQRRHPQRKCRSERPGHDVYFEFGPTSAYGYQTSAASAGSGTSTVSVTALLSGLQSNQTYHYRLVAVSGAGTTLGADATFKTTTAPPTASKLDVFGHTAFVAPQGVGGIFLGCIGQTTCTGKMTIRRGSETIGQRLRFTIGANDGGIVHYTLTRRGQSLLRRLHHMPATVVVTPTQGPGFSRGVTLVPFS